MASWLMVTSVGASVDVHFCAGEIFSIGIDARADKCSEFEEDFQQNRRSAIACSSCCNQFSAYFQFDIDIGNDDVAIQYSIDFFVIPVQHNVKIPIIDLPIHLCQLYNPPQYEEDHLTLFSILRI